MSDRVAKVIKKCDDDLENAKDEDLIYDLAGFAADEKSNVVGLGPETKQDDNYQIILRTLSRYNCTKIAPLFVLEQLSASELSLFQPKNTIDLGMYPMPLHMLDDPIEFISQHDEATNGRLFQQSTFELVEHGKTTRKVFHQTFVAPEEHDKLKVLRYGEFSVNLEPSSVDYMEIGSDQEEERPVDDPVVEKIA